MRRGTGKFTAQGFEAAKKYHLCLSCRHHQTANWKDDPCPSCGRSDTRQFFMSRKEMERGAQLLLNRDTGLIKNLRFQPRYDLIVNGMKICTYVADAEYIDSAGRMIVEDVKPKGFTADVAALKIAMFNALFQPQTVTYYR